MEIFNIITKKIHEKQEDTSNKFSNMRKLREKIVILSMILSTTRQDYEWTEETRDGDIDTGRM